MSSSRILHDLREWPVCCHIAVSSFSIGTSRLFSCTKLAKSGDSFLFVV